jgi:hypothetical protein
MNLRLPNGGPGPCHTARLPTRGAGGIQCAGRATFGEHASDVPDGAAIEKVRGLDGNVDSLSRLRFQWLVSLRMALAHLVHCWNLQENHGDGACFAHMFCQ